MDGHHFCFHDRYSIYMNVVEVMHTWPHSMPNAVDELCIFLIQQSKWRPRNRNCRQCNVLILEACIIPYLNSLNLLSSVFYNFQSSERECDDSWCWPSRPCCAVRMPAGFWGFQTCCYKLQGPWLEPFWFRSLRGSECPALLIFLQECNSEPSSGHIPSIWCWEFQPVSFLPGNVHED